MVQYILIIGIHAYRWVISPAKVFLFGPLGRCRFTPSCSAYALEAIKQRGALSGSWLAINRICRCHPWGGCGEDPVPPLIGPTHRQLRSTEIKPGMNSRQTETVPTSHFAHSSQ